MKMQVMLLSIMNKLLKKWVSLQKQEMIEEENQGQKNQINTLKTKESISTSQAKDSGSLDTYSKIQKRYEKYPEPPEERNRFYGLLFIILQVIYMISYGISAQYFRQAETVKLYDLINLILLGVFAIFGFGLVLSVYRWGNWLGLASAIIVFATSAQISPLFQMLWYILFLKNSAQINYSINSSSETYSFFFHNYLGATMKIQISLYTYKTIFLSCISILTFMTATIGRLSLMQVFKITLVYQLFWNLNFYLNIYLCTFRNGSLVSPAVFDTYGSSYCYLFAVFFGILFTVITKNNSMPIDHIRNVLSGFSWAMSSLGTAFLFATFVFGYTNFVKFPTQGQSQQMLSMLLALCASVVGTYCGSAFVNKGKIGYKDALIGTIVGGVAIGSAAPVVYNPGIALLIGSATGFLSGLLNSFISSKINKSSMHDVLGLFVPFMLSSLIGSFIVPSVHYYIYYTNYVNNGYYLWENDKSIIGQTEATHVLIYAGISIAIGLAGGLIAGILCRWDTPRDRNASQLKFFDYDLGLYTPQSHSTARKSTVQQQQRNNQSSNQAMINNDAE